MIFSVALEPGTALANVVYSWIAAGAPVTPTASGVSQPNTAFAVFRIDCVPPADAEEMIVYDSTDIDNWNVAGFLEGLTELANADQIILTQPYTPTGAPTTIVPASPASLSICRCYGTWIDVSALSVNGVPMTLTLVAVDTVDPTLIYNLSSTTLKNTETGLLIAERVVNLLLVSGHLENVNEDQFVDLNRTDYISGAPPGTALEYLLTCDSLGAPMSMSILSVDSPVTFTPVLFKLDTSTIGLTSGGTFDLSKKAVA